MGKSKKGGKGSSKQAAAAVCNCVHPFTCDCGHRPERPSRGHKWDSETKTWGGKGHKQKGASGQISSVSQTAKTTSVGQTKLEQWQKLPSQLLEDMCQKQRKLRPKYKNIEKTGGGKKMFKYRIILPDGKNEDRDQFFVPAQAVANEEQAKEEACLLALLHLTPSLPHERKLPDPYKQTWLAAIQTLKQEKANNKKKPGKGDTAAAPPSSGEGSAPNTGNNAPKRNNNIRATAQASTTLAMSVSHATSASERRKLQQEKQRIRNAKIRRHENIRLANQNHPVFMSASIRRQLERLLRGDANFFNDNDNDNNDDDDDVSDAEDNDVQVFVESRLRQEGFTKRQARTAYGELQQQQSRHSATSNEEEWDKVYEDCLQWLLIHLNEDQLPVGFDPRGRTLDVIGGSGSKQPAASLEISQFAQDYGISVPEALWLNEKAKQQKSGGGASLSPELLYAAAMQVAGVTATKNDDAASGGGDTEANNMETTDEELEALTAIFEDCQVSRDTSSNTTSISVPLENRDLSLVVCVANGRYPAIPPSCVTVKGKWPTMIGGAAAHIEIARFVSDLAIGEPMFFEIHGQVNEILQLSPKELPPVSLIIPGPTKTIAKQPATSNNNAGSSQKSSADNSSKSTSQRKRNNNSRNVNRRPRERHPFWSRKPSETPTADSSEPNISRALAAQRRSLPAAGVRDEFLSALRKADQGGRVILVTGETGSGKTTQIPQFILEELPREAKIVVCQPRRLAATGVATRVAEERGEKQPGTKSVGYVVRGDTAMCKESRLVFCTTGVLLRQLQSEGALECLTHIVVDEVHERQLDTDVLLGLLKQSLPSYKNLRVVLMSATLDADRFAGYWGRDTPRMHIPGRTFPVTDFMLEDVLSLTGYLPRKPKKKSNGKHSSGPTDDEESENEEDQVGSNGIRISELVKRVDETSIDYDLLATLIRHLVKTKSAGSDGSILCFLPGAPEINKALDTVKRCAGDQPMLLLPLHGGLQPREQNLVFKPVGAGINATKVILSTNVAETSVTIPDCTIVIDCGREKQSSYDPVNRMPMLVEQFCSKASLKQRRGRAGRVREGTCYKLISRSTLGKLREHGEPEIQRCALDQTLLSLLFLGVERSSTGVFMKTLLDPPSKKSLDAAIFSLRQVGAVEVNESNDDLILTPMGMQLAGIPAPPTVGKIMIIGSILGCRSAALAMAAGMSLGRSPFLRIDTPRRRKNEEVDERTAIQDMKNENIVKQREEMFKTVGSSDHALLAHIFMTWQDVGAGGGQRKTICDRLGLSFNGMRDMLQLVRQLDSSLSAVGYHSSNESDRNGHSWRIIRSCAVSALSPGQLVKVVRPATTYHETAEGAKEKDGEARGLKFFVRTTADQESSMSTAMKEQEERVFIHPASANFSTGSYSCPWLVYHSLVRTSKPFLRDVTECSAYALLLFGGKLDVQASKGVIVVDGWAALAANARIGSLMAGLRQQVDDLLRKKVSDPSFEIAGTKEMGLIVKLVVTDGLGT